MNKIYIFLFATLFSASGYTQTTHNVSVLDFEFDPTILTIDQGDIVIWTNAGGNHNVDGNTITFPNNPVGFGNQPSTDPWTFEVTFDTPGNYDYRCAVHPTLMTGRVIVQTVNSTNEQSSQILKAFPIPADDYIIIDGLEEFSGQSQLEIVDITGKKVMETLVSTKERVDINSLNAGIYLFNITSEGNKRFTGKILKR